MTFRALRIRQDLNINMASSTRRSFGQGELSGRPIARPHGSANYNDGRGQFGQRFSHARIDLSIPQLEHLRSCA